MALTVPTAATGTLTIVSHRPPRPFSSRATFEDTGGTGGSNSPDSGSDASLKQVKDGVLGVYNPLSIAPGVICSLFLLCAVA